MRRALLFVLVSGCSNADAPPAPSAPPAIAPPAIAPPAPRVAPAVCQSYCDKEASCARAGSDDAELIRLTEELRRVCLERCELVATGAAARNAYGACAARDCAALEGCLEGPPH